MSPTVIVFGPTGNIASVAARTAESHGAKVVLAMRDPCKSIPGLTREEEDKGSYERVQADLTQPDSLTTAVKSSGATRAFMYSAHGAQDHMRSCLEALKSAGIEFIVFLSSFTIGPYGGEPRNVPKEDIIPYVHAQVEINLDDIYGPEKYVAVRPGGFATNMLRHKDGIAKGEVRLHGGHFRLDFITPTDMGRVSGTILATQTGPKNGQGKVYLFGPQVTTTTDAIGRIGKVLGKEVKITTIGEEEAQEQFAAAHIPKFMADYMIRVLRKPVDEEKQRPNYQEGVENVQLYTGQAATTFEDWVVANKELFSA